MYNALQLDEDEFIVLCVILVLGALFIEAWISTSDRRPPRDK